MPTDYYYQQTVKSMSDVMIKYYNEHRDLDFDKPEIFYHLIDERYSEIISKEREEKLNDILNDKL